MKTPEDAWHRYQDALKAELELWFGAQNDVVAWHTLCNEIGFQPPPSNCKSCEKARPKQMLTSTPHVLGSLQQRLNTSKSLPLRASHK